jgi:hypothetical protein
VIGYAIAISGGFLWEGLVKQNVPLLTKFEIFTHFSDFRDSKGKAAAVLKRIIASFSTSFWIEENRWLIIGNWLVNRNEFEIYTSPICNNSPPLTFDENMKTVSNFDRELRPSTMSDYGKLYAEILFQSNVSSVRRSKNGSNSFLFFCLERRER